jgi:hypothetical protein
MLVVHVGVESKKVFAASAKNARATEGSVVEGQLKSD